jgi:hypothetical protein
MISHSPSIAWGGRRPGGSAPPFDPLTSGRTGGPFIGSTRMPAAIGSMQDFTGRPLAITLHCAHCPFAQKMPSGAPSLGCRPKIRMPLAKRAEAIVSPSTAANVRPSQKNSRRRRSGTARMGCSTIR